MQQPRLRGFVAMAFGRPDTDRWYAKSVKPLLEAHGIEPRRVDQITHNDDVDDRIIAELKSAHLAIADLTYARPSVYYEAGYAAGRPIPVIYTCRSDHLDEGAKDPLRVHFDLQMKNFAAWDSPEDRTFATKFRKLLNHEARPIREKLREEGRSKAEAHAFAAMSRRAQLDALVRGAKQAAWDRDLEVWTLTNNAGQGTYWTSWFRGLSVLTCSSWHGNCLEGVQFIVHHRFNKTELDTVAALVHDPQFNLQVPLRPEPRKLSHVFDLTVVVSLESLRLARVRAALPLFEAISSANKHLLRKGRENFIRRGRSVIG